MASFLPSCPIFLAPETNKSPCCPPFVPVIQCRESLAQDPVLLQPHVQLCSVYLTAQWRCAAVNIVLVLMEDVHREEHEGEKFSSFIAKMFQDRVRQILTVMEFLNKQISSAILLLERNVWQEEIFDSIPQPPYSWCVHS